MKSINKALDILDTLADYEELRLSEICDITGFTKSTANLILSALVERGYAVQKERRGKYSLNNNYLTINRESKYNKHLRQISEQYLILFSNNIRENVILCTKYENMARIIVLAETKNVLTTTVQFGAIIPLYCTATGKILLAHFPKNELTQYLETMELNQLTPNTITDKNYLRVTLEMVIKEGIAYDDEEQHIGAKGVAVPVKDSKGQIIASAGVFGPSARLTREKIADILPDLKKCAETISEALIQNDFSWPK